MKALAVAVVALEWLLLPAPYRSIVPGAVALPWVLAGAYNAWVLAAVATATI